MGKLIFFPDVIGQVNGTSGGLNVSQQPGIFLAGILQQLDTVARRQDRAGIVGDQMEQFALIGGRLALLQLYNQRLLPFQITGHRFRRIAHNGLAGQDALFAKGAPALPKEMVKHNAAQGKEQQQKDPGKGRLRAAIFRNQPKGDNQPIQDEKIEQQIRICVKPLHHHQLRFFSLVSVAKAQKQPRRRRGRKEEQGKPFASLR